MVPHSTRCFSLPPSVSICENLWLKSFWIFLKLLQRRIHLVPRLRVGSPDMHPPFEQGGIIQARSVDTSALFADAAEKPRATVRAKPAFVVTAGLARRGIEARRAFCDFEFCRHIHNRGKRSASGALAITTMTVKHHDRFSCAFVANRAASASAGKRSRHILRVDHSFLTIGFRSLNRKSLYELV